MVGWISFQSTIFKEIEEVKKIGLNVNEGKAGCAEARRKFIIWINSSNCCESLEFYKIYWRTNIECPYEPRDINCISLWCEYGIYYVKINIDGEDYPVGIGDNVDDGYDMLRSAISDINYCYNEHMTKQELKSYIRHLHNRYRRY